MKYETFIDFFTLKDGQCIRLISQLYFGFIVILLSIIGVYFTTGRDLNFKLITCYVIFLAVMGYIQYWQVVPNSEVVNQTAIEVEISETEINVVTASFKVLFWFNQPSNF